MVKEPTKFYFLTPAGRVAISSKEQYQDGIRKYNLLAVRDSTGEEKVVHSPKTGWYDKKPRVFEDLFVSLHFEIPFNASDEVVSRLVELSKTDPIKTHERIAYITKQHEKREKEKAAKAAASHQQPKEGTK